MSSRPRFALVALVALATAAAALTACGGGETAPPAPKAAARIDAVSDLNRTVVVGSSLPNAVVVQVSDSGGHALAGASVAFAVTSGNGTVTPSVATTDVAGQATATWNVGTIAGANEVTASVAGVVNPVKFEATGTPGPVSAISFSVASVRLLVNVDTAHVSASSVDAYGNATTPSPTLTVRDPAVATIDASGLVQVGQRGSGTYIVATAGAKSDSIPVTALAVGQSICTGAANPVTLDVGQVITDVSGSGFCVHAASANAEYALIPYFNSDSPGVTTQFQVKGQGITKLSAATSALLIPRAGGVVPRPTLVPDDAFESRLRDRERAAFSGRLSAARTWLRARRDVAVSKPAAANVPALGSLLKLNTNAEDPCDSLEMRTGRVVAITNRAIVVADTANPAGGFTDAEYQSIGVTFDTLVDPTDRAAFGDPSDIDNNGHVIMFFTSAVNELTSQGASSVVLGFFYQRDLFPKSGPAGTCQGSNVGEMFYLMVPDTGGVVHGNVRTKTQVVTFTNGTVAHEYQHLINASRRMYVNDVGPNFEEKWLDEGLAHVAEELNFWKASGRSPRQNIDVSGFSDPVFTSAYNTFQLNNQRRYASYLATTPAQAPIGASPLDDDVQTRGAIWSFLRFAADHVAAGDENAFWHALVNSDTTGVANLTKVLGAAPNALLRDWAISVFLDDNTANADPRFQQPSWNMRSIMTNNGTGLAFPLATRQLADGTTANVGLSANGVTFLRFSVANGQDALLTATSGAQPLSPAIQLAIVRVR